jgi:hypothetical protein
MIERRSFVILAGVALLVAGCFLPIVTVGTVGDSIYWRYWDDLSYWDMNRENDIPADGPGLITLIFAATALLMLWMDQSEYTWLPGILILVYTFSLMNSVWGNIHNTNIDLSIGWGLLLLGSGLLIIAPKVSHSVAYDDFESLPGDDLLDEQP